MKKQILILAMFILMFVLNGCEKEINNLETVEDNTVSQNEDYDAESTEENNSNQTIQDYSSGELVSEDASQQDGADENVEKNTVDMIDGLNLLQSFFVQICNSDYEETQVVKLANDVGLELNNDNNGDRSKNEVHYDSNDKNDTFANDYVCATYYEVIYLDGTKSFSYYFSSTKIECKVFITDKNNKQITFGSSVYGLELPDKEYDSVEEAMIELSEITRNWESK